MLKAAVLLAAAAIALSPVSAAQEDDKKGGRIRILLPRVSLKMIKISKSYCVIIFSFGYIVRLPVFLMAQLVH